VCLQSKTGDLKAGGILVADVVETFSIKGYRAISWKYVADLL
jgi:hypothetical protein